MALAIKSKMPPKSVGHSNDFQTPAYAVRYITPWVSRLWNIWEPACGEGRIVDTLRQDGYTVTGTDIKTGWDFLKHDAPPDSYDCIITNPPYTIKDKWLRRCYELGKPFALLLPITALGEQKRVKLFREKGIQLIMPPKRVMFTSPSGVENGTWFYTAWFCYGFPMINQITFVGEE